MDATQLRALHEEYRIALDKGRDDTLPEDSKKKALEDAFKVRRQLDDAFIEKEQEREDNERLAAVEARQAAVAKVAAVAPQPVTRSNIPTNDLKRYAAGEINNMSFTLEPTEQRTDVIDETSNAGAHYIVPSSMLDRIVNFRLQASGVLRAGPTVLNTTNGQVINIPVLTTDLTSLAGTQGAASTVTNPVWATKDLSAFRIDGHALVADELFRDSGVDMNMVLGNLAGRSLGKKVAAYLSDFEVGTGSTLPNAVTLGSTASAASASNTTITIDELKTIYYTLIPEYRMNASWVALNALTLIIATAKDDTGNYIWQPSNLAAEPDRLWGRPWYDDGLMSTMATANRPLAFGDMSCYWVRFSGGTEVSFSRDFEFTSFSTTVRWAQWLDAVVADAAGINYLLLAT